MFTLHAIPIAAPGDTWGISGPDFLTLDAIVAAVVILGALAYRFIALRGPRADVNRQPTAVEIAYLRGGGPLAVMAAVAGLRAVGAIDSEARGRLAATGPYPADATRLDWAVYDAAQHGVRQRDLLNEPGVSTAVAEIRDGLQQAGLLRSPEDRARLRMGGLLTLLVAAFGIARIVSGLRNDRPVGYLILLTIGVAVAGGLLLIVGERSAAGSHAIKQATRDSRHLSPGQAPAWSTYGLAGAAMGVAVFGTAALWAADPAFAEQAEVERQLGGAGSAGASTSGCGGGSTAGGDGGGGCGGGGCGGGGCGG